MVANRIDEDVRVVGDLLAEGVSCIEDQLVAGLDERQKLRSELQAALDALGRIAAAASEANETT